MLTVIRHDRGQAVLEFALVLPILLLLLFGIIEFGIVFHDNLVLNQAAREGARLGAVGGTDEEIRMTVERVAASLDPARLQLEIDPPEEERLRGDRLRVEVRYSVPIVTPIMAEFLPNPYPLAAAVTMRVE